MYVYTHDGQEGTTENKIKTRKFPNRSNSETF